MLFRFCLCSVSIPHPIIHVECSFLMYDLSTLLYASVMVPYGTVGVLSLQIFRLQLPCQCQRLSVSVCLIGIQGDAGYSLFPLSPICINFRNAHPEPSTHRRTYPGPIHPVGTFAAQDADVWHCIVPAYHWQVPRKDAEASGGRRTPSGLRVTLSLSNNIII